MKVIEAIIGLMTLAIIVAMGFTIWLAYGWWSVPAIPCLLFLGHAYGKRAEAKGVWRETGAGEQRPTMHGFAIDFTSEEHIDDRKGPPMDMQLRAKKIACKTAAILCEQDMEAGRLEQRYGDLKAKGGPSVGMITKGMEALIEELRERSKPV